MNPERICYGCFREKEPGKYCPHCGFHEKEEQPYLALPLGTILNGRYMTGKVLGIGGFGITYLGYDLTLDIRVAIKEYMPSALATRHSDHYQVTLTGKTDADYQNGMKRFLDEAKILARLQNTPNIVSVQNYFQENNTAYFVMEYVEGVNLRAYLDAQGGRISWEKALELLAPVMKALTQVHAQHILHRDISPENICITSSGESRLLDFGAARSAVREGKSVSVILKHGYAPEEQYSSHGNQGPWTDVYAMGATLYRCITGILPPDAVERIHGDTLKAPSQLGIAVPSGGEAALLKALAVRTEDRFRDMQSFLDALTGPAQAGMVQADTPQENVVSGSNTAVSRSGFPAQRKVPPVLAALLGGGLAAAALLCVFLSGAFSTGNTAGEAAADAGGSAWTDVSESGSAAPEDSQQNQEGGGQSQNGADTGQDSGAFGQGAGSSEEKMVSWDLDDLNAVIRTPENYSVSESGWLFYDETQETVLLVDYRWAFEIPVYSLTDVEEHAETVAAWGAEQMSCADCEILGTGGCTVGGRAGFQICMESGSGASADENLLMTMVESDNGFGCYLMMAVYPADRPDKETEVLNIIASFQSGGPVNVPYSCYYDEEAGIQIIVNDSLAGGGVKTSGRELILYPSEEAAEAGTDNLNSDSAGMVETGSTELLGLYTPQDTVDAFSEQLQSGGAAAGEAYTVVRGGCEWLCQDYALGDYSFSCAAAVIDGQCYYVYCMYNAANSDTVITLYQETMDTVRPL